MIKTLLLILIPLSVGLFSQGQTQLIGRVLDKSTQEALPFAHVIMLKKQLGTTTDGEGFFKLPLFNPMPDDSVVVQYVGYELYKCDVASFLEDKNTIIGLIKKELLIEEVVISAKPVDIDKFMKLAVKAYWKSRRSAPHIALAHYREKAKFNGEYVMFSESIGYAIYAGDRKHEVESNYTFFCDNTRKSDRTSGWLQFIKTDMDGHKNSDQGCRSSMTYQSFIALEKWGPLSKKEWKGYSFSLDSSYFENGRKVYLITFDSNGIKGDMTVFEDNFEFRSIKSSKRVRTSFVSDEWTTSHSDIRYVYFNNQPFIKSIKLYQKENELEYWNECHTLLQKLDNFKLDKEEVWSYKTYSWLPFVYYNEDIWNQYSFPKEVDYFQIKQHLESTNATLDQQFKNNSGKWWLPNYKETLPEVIVEGMEQRLTAALVYMKSLRQIF